MFDEKKYMREYKRKNREKLRKQRVEHEQNLIKQGLCRTGCGRKLVTIDKCAECYIQAHQDKQLLLKALRFKDNKIKLFGKVIKRIPEDMTDAEFFTWNPLVQCTNKHCGRWVPLYVKGNTSSGVIRQNSATHDHIHPRSRGGMDDINNLTCLCSICNWIKHARPISYLDTEIGILKIQNYGSRYQFPMDILGLRQWFKSLGLCKRCGNVYPKKGGKMCEECLQKVRRKRAENIK